MSRNIDLAPDEFYHIYNRGTEKRTIFLSQTDYERFVGLLYACNGDKPVDLKLQGSTLEELVALERGETLVDICAYCLMPNHFHLLIKEKEAGGASRMMQKLITAYTMYFNKRYERTGSLFQGRFKATHAAEDRYLSYLISYIHLNPIKLIEPVWKETGIKEREKAEEYLKNYSHSSFLDYAGESRVESCIINKEALPSYFETPRDFQTSVFEWLGHKQG